MDLKKIFASGLVFVMMISKSSAIRCFQCNSALNSACLDIDDKKTTTVPTVNCEAAVPSAVPIKFFCRKINRTIFHPNRESEVHVTRGCGWGPFHKKCYSDHLISDCQCFSDRCNGSERVKFSVLVVLGVLVGYLFTK